MSSKIEKKDLKTIYRRYLALNCMNDYPGQMHNGYTFSLLPVLDKIYKDNKEVVTIGPTSQIFYNDAGTLYSNMLYAVKIIYKYTSKNVLGEYNTEGIEWDHFEWRWLWTNTMFN